MTRRGLCANVFSNPIRALILLDAGFGYKVDRLSLEYSSQWIAIILSLYGGIFVMGRKTLARLELTQIERFVIRHENEIVSQCVVLISFCPRPKKWKDWMKVSKVCHITPDLLHDKCRSIDFFSAHQAWRVPLFFLHFWCSSQEYYLLIVYFMMCLSILVSSGATWKAIFSTILSPNPFL